MSGKDCITTLPKTPLKTAKESNSSQTVRQRKVLQPEVIDSNPSFDLRSDPVSRANMVGASAAETYIEQAELQQFTSNIGSELLDYIDSEDDVDIDVDTAPLVPKQVPKDVDVKYKSSRTMEEEGEHHVQHHVQPVSN